MSMRARSVVLFCLCAASACSSYAQDWTRTNEFTKTLSIYDKDGKRFVDNNADVDGTPFFLKAWNPGYIRLTDDKTYSIARMRFDVLGQAVHYLDAGQQEMVVAGAVKEIGVIDSASGSRQVFTFANGYPAIDNQTSLSYYLVLEKGRVSLLESVRKAVVEQKNALGGETRKEFVSYEDYYFFDGKTMIRIKKDKDFILGQLADKKDPVTAYVSKNNLRYKSITDIKNILAYYNTLP